MEHARRVVAARRVSGVVSGIEESAKGDYVRMRASPRLNCLDKCIKNTVSQTIIALPKRIR